MQGYDPNLSSRYIGLSKKPHQALSILVIPIHEKMASGPWTSSEHYKVFIFKSAIFIIKLTKLAEINPNLARG